MRRLRRRPVRIQNPGYRPDHAWLGYPGDGVRLKHRDPSRRWRFRWVQLRMLAIAVAVLGIAWWHMPAA
jgi:hypothetical protein